MKERKPEAVKRKAIVYSEFWLHMSLIEQQLTQAGVCFDACLHRPASSQHIVACEG
jgi:hypothetical protein